MMKCPCCGNEMEWGFVQSHNEIFYTNKEKKGWIPVPRKDDVRLTTNPTAPATCDAHHCPNCRMVIIKY